MRRRNRQLFGACALLAAVTILAIVAQSGFGQRELRRLGVVGPRDQFTELAFVAPARLPNTLSARGATLHVPFTVTSHERGVTTYTWQIAGAPARGARGNAGLISLRPGQQTYLDPVITLGCSARTQISVTLGSGQRISFWAACIPAARSVAGGRVHTAATAHASHARRSRQHRPTRPGDTGSRGRR